MPTVVSVLALVVIFTFLGYKANEQQNRAEQCAARSGVYVDGHCLLTLEVKLP